ncbi:MAG: hypothetical protein CBE00_13365 [Planctomycetaceae bacterium TMED240]|nr:MAG: hypothetical protein CBE00_13365 [Planctomycetaceae bacterium TMED240]
MADPKVQGKTTVKRKKVTGSIEGLSMYEVKREDPAYRDIKAKLTAKRLKRSGIDVRTKDNPDGRMIPTGYTTKGDIRLIDSQNKSDKYPEGKPYDYPKSSSIPGHSHLRRRRDAGYIDTVATGRYHSGVIEGTIEPVESAKAPNYKVNRKEVIVEVEVKNTGAAKSDQVAGQGTSDDNKDAIATAEEENAIASGSNLDGSGGAHIPSGGITPRQQDALAGRGEFAPGSEFDAPPGSQYESQIDVEKDPNRAPVLVFNELDEAGQRIPNTGGIKYLTKEEAIQLNEEGLIKDSLLEDHIKIIDAQNKLADKGEFPFDREKYIITPDGKLIPKNNVSKDADGNFRDITTGSAFTGFDNENAANLKEDLTTQPRGPRVKQSIAGVPGEHKVRLYTKNPSWLEKTLETLKKTGNGIVFPYTPTINVNHSANYGTYDINQSVEQPHFYSMTPNVSLQLTAVFTANTLTEAEYMLACMHFLRTATKSDFGAYNNGLRRTDAGTPPPVLVFSGYGTEMFNNIPVIVRSVNFTLPEDVDYVSIQTQAAQVLEGAFIDVTNLDANGNNIQTELQAQEMAGTEIEPSYEKQADVNIPSESSTVPTSILFSIDLAPQHPPSQLRDEWNFKDYASGDLLRKGYI